MVKVAVSMGNISPATATHKPPLAVHDTTNLSWNIDRLIIRFWEHQNPSRIFFEHGWYLKRQKMLYFVVDSTDNGMDIAMKESVILFVINMLSIYGQRIYVG